MRLDPDQALEKARNAVRQCRILGGVFALAWHNTMLMDRGYARFYNALLDELSGCESYDWRSAPNENC